MPAPSPGNFHTPSGVQMPDGFSTKISMSLLPTAPMWELSVKIGGVDGGEKIKISTMRNTLWHTAKFRTLLMQQDTSVEVSFDPKVLEDIKAVANKNQTITFWFPDGSTYAFFGAVTKIGELSMEEGTLPKATVTFCASNIDPADNKSEFGPVFTPATGT